MAAITFTDLVTNTEWLLNRITKRAYSSNMWMNAVPRGVFEKNTGVEHTTFTVQPSEPDDTNALGDEITLGGDDGNTPVSGDPAEQCPTTYEVVPVKKFSRTYNARRIKWQGPVVCKDELTYRHDVRNFLNSYETILTRNAQRRLEFASRENYLNMIGFFSDGVFYPGPDALGDVVPPTSDITQGQLDICANYLNGVGASEPDSLGFVMLGGAGPLYTLEIGSMASQRILKNNHDRRQDARWAMPNELWRRIGATTIIGSFRHATTQFPPRAVDVGGVLTRVRTFRSATEMDAGGVRTTPEYDAALYELATVVIPQVMTFEVVMPEDYKFGTHLSYMGELEWIEGAERIIGGVADPEHLFGAFFGRIEYAPAPNDPALGAGIWYQRPPVDVAASDIYAYPGSEGT